MVAEALFGVNDRPPSFRLRLELEGCIHLLAAMVEVKYIPYVG